MNWLSGTMKYYLTEEEAQILYDQLRVIQHVLDEVKAMLLQTED